jgi:hypothetical protein
MTSGPVRAPLADHLLAPQNAALLFIGYQPAPLAGSAGSLSRSILLTTQHACPCALSAAGEHVSAETACEFLYKALLRKRVVSTCGIAPPSW